MEILVDSYNLPAPIRHALKKQHEAHKMLPGVKITCTSIIDSPLVFYLKQHFEVKVEMARRLWTLYGSLMHAILAQYALELNDEAVVHVEKTLVAEVDGVGVSATLDFLKGEKTGTLYDYKYTSTFAVSDGLKIEHVNQLNTILAIGRRSPDREIVESVKSAIIVAMLRDWGPRHKKEFPVGIKQLDVPIWNPVEADKYLCERIALHKRAWESDSMPPECSETERWVRVEGFAVMKRGRKSAVKLFMKDEYNGEMDVARRNADAFAIEKGDDHEVVLRKSKACRCEEYCDYSEVCPYWKSHNNVEEML